MGSHKVTRSPNKVRKVIISGKVTYSVLPSADADFELVTRVLRSPRKGSTTPLTPPSA